MYDHTSVIGGGVKKGESSCAVPGVNRSIECSGLVMPLPPPCTYQRLRAVILFVGTQCYCCWVMLPSLEASMATSSSIYSLVVLKEPWGENFTLFALNAFNSFW